MTREEKNHEKQSEIFKEERKESLKKHIILGFKIFLVVTLIALGGFFYITYVSTTGIIVKEERIVNSKIPDNFNGLKIIQFSDLHYGSTMFYDDLKKVAQLINERNPDIVVFTGDLIDEDYKLSSKEQEKIISVLKSIEASLGKYAIMGEEDSENFITIFNQSEFNFLNNSYDLIYKGDNNPILLTGTSSLLKEQNDINKSFDYFNQETYNSNIYTIALIHEPDLTTEIKDNYDADLILAGHSHNGNIRIPYVGPLFKNEGSSEYSDWHYSVDSSQLYISSGLGTSDIDFRLFCRPSINFFRLSNK